MVLQVGAVRHKLPDALARGQRRAQGRRADRPHRARRDAPPARGDATRRRRRRAGAAARPRRPRRRCSTRSAAPACRCGCRSRASAVPLPRAIDLSAYRIVQEGLTNALKHARASQADVDRPLRARRAARSRSATTAAAAATSDGLGHGLVGIRERVKIYGGEMSAGTANGGGFVLSTRLPLERRAADDASASSSPTTSRWCAPASACCSPARTDIEVVAEASNGLEAVDKAARFQPDRRPDGHPHARARRPRGDPAHPRRRRRRADPDPHDVRPRRVHLRGAQRRRQRLRPQGRPARAADRRRSARSPPATRCSHPRSRSA